jgi:hypothetical protein
MVLSLFVVSTVGRGLWNEISKELVTTRLTKFSRIAFAICYTHTKARNWVSRDSGTDFRIFFGNKILTFCVIQEIYTIKEYTELERIIRI